MAYEVDENITLDDLCDCIDYILKRIEKKYDDLEDMINETKTDIKEMLSALRNALQMSLSKS